MSELHDRTGGRSAGGTGGNEQESIESLRRAREELEQRLTFHIQRMPLGYVVWDKDFRVQEWNPAAEATFGWPAAEAKGKRSHELMIPPEARSHVNGIWAKLLGGNDSSVAVIENVRKTGERITCEWFSAPLRGPSDEIVGAISMIHDITDTLRLEKQLRTAQRMEAVGTLAGGVAHDFNNALTGIIGFGELLRERIAGDPRALSDLDQILRCAERAATLTRQLLAFARRQVIEPVNLSLNAAVSDLMRLVGKVSGAHIEVRTVLARDLPAIRADRGQVEQVLMNLCLNARDAMTGGGQLLVESDDVTLDEGYVRQAPYMKPGRYAVLSVSDTGVGMDEKTRERVYEPFFTTKGPDKGTGLGLAVVYGIVKQHDGYIHLYSEPGTGTTFRVYFPAVEGPPDSVMAVVKEPVRSGTETILLADDEPAIRDIAEETLREFGYTVLTARNGEEAVELFRRHGEEVALAILDVVMPRKGGKEAFEEMRRANPGLKVLFTSGYSANAIHESFALIAGVPFLPKPFGPASLARKVREVLDG